MTSLNAQVEELARMDFEDLVTALMSYWPRLLLCRFVVGISSSPLVAGGRACPLAGENDMSGLVIAALHAWVALASAGGSFQRPPGAPSLA